MLKRLGKQSVRIPAFTLIELLVVVAIIALLISILLPSLNAARASSKATKCSANLHHVGQAIHQYLSENKAVFPLSYYYASDANGGYDINNQSDARQWGYIHWSYQLYSNGEVNHEAFQCPEIEQGGHPRTNPGPDPADWFDEQQDHAGNSKPADINPSLAMDRQARFMAYTANRAIMPRNRIGNIGEGLQRRNRFVKESEVEEAGRVIVATEFNNNWKTITRTSSSNSNESLSHRPVMPFYFQGHGYNEDTMPNIPADTLSYWVTREDVNYGLLLRERIEDGSQLVEESGIRPLNMVGRHHPGGDRLGGSANFLYVDGHVMRKTILQTLRDREWGKAYYGLTGKNRVYEDGWTYEPR